MSDELPDYSNAIGDDLCWRGIKKSRTLINGFFEAFGPEEREAFYNTAEGKENFCNLVNEMVARLRAVSDNLSQNGEIEDVPDVEFMGKKWEAEFDAVLQKLISLTTVAQKRKHLADKITEWADDFHDQSEKTRLQAQLQKVDQEKK